MLSTASSPSTNSDVPEKPPPPYPGVGIAHQQHLAHSQNVQMGGNCPFGRFGKFI
jgi:hypothetical protein